MKEEIGFRVKQARIKANLTQEALAEKANVSSSFISRLESGKAMPSIERLLHLSEVLDIGLQDLLCDLFREPEALEESMSTKIMYQIDLMTFPEREHIFEYIQLLNKVLHK